MKLLRYKNSNEVFRRFHKIFGPFVYHSNWRKATVEVGNNKRKKGLKKACSLYLTTVRLALLLLLTWHLPSANWLKLEKTRIVAFTNDTGGLKLKWLYYLCVLIDIKVGIRDDLTTFWQDSCSVSWYTARQKSMKMISVKLT